MKLNHLQKRLHLLAAGLVILQSQAAAGELGRLHPTEARKTRIESFAFPYAAKGPIAEEASQHPVTVGTIRPRVANILPETALAVRNGSQKRQSDRPQIMAGRFTSLPIHQSNRADEPEEGPEDTRGHLGGKPLYFIAEPSWTFGDWVKWACHRWPLFLLLFIAFCPVLFFIHLQWMNHRDWQKLLASLNTKDPRD